jgi:hypothetical protein
MKYLLLTIVAVLLMPLLVTAQVHSLIPYRKGTKWGFADRKGKTQISPKYDQVYLYTEGLAAVKKKGKWGYIDINGKEVIPPQYEAVKPFYKGHAVVEKQIKSEQVGVIDSMGKVVLPLKYASVSNINDHNLFEVSLSKGILNEQVKHIGFVDIKGKEVIAPHKYKNGLRDIQANGIGWLCQQKGEEAYECRVFNIINETASKEVYHSAFKFHEGLAAVTIGNKYGFVNQKGELVIDALFDEESIFSEGKAAVAIDDEYIVIDTTGSKIYDQTFDWAEYYVNGLMAVEIGEKWGAVDEKGQFVIPAQYENLIIRQNYIIAVLGQDALRREGVLDRKGRIVTPIVFRSITLSSDEKYIIFEKENEKKGVMTIGGTMIIEPIYENIEYVGDDVFSIENEDEEIIGYIDARGRKYFN